MEFIPTLPTYASDLTAQTVWGWIRDRVQVEDGVCFYKYPNVGGPDTPQPDLTIVTRNHQPLVVRCLDVTGEQILKINDDSWIIEVDGKQTEIDSPLLELGDIVVALQEKFDRQRSLRKLFKVESALTLPLVERSTFNQRFGDLGPILWDENGVTRYLSPRPNLR